MSENKWKTGDQVQLKSGGPVMTVTMEAEYIPGYLRPIGMIRCDWNVEGNAYGNYYAPDAVEHAWLRSDPDNATRDRHVDGLSQEVEAEQTLLTAHTEIAKLKAALKDEALAHATTRKLLGESNADHNKLVVKVAELEKKLGDLVLSKRAGYHDEIREALGATGSETILDAAQRVATWIRLNKRREADINEAIGVQGSETALGAVKRLHGKVADLDTKLAFATSRIAWIESNPIAHLRDQGFSEITLSQTSAPKKHWSHREIGPTPRPAQGSDVQVGDVAHGVDDVHRLSSIIGKLTEERDEARALVGCPSVEPLATSIHKVRNALGARHLEALLDAAGRLASSLSDEANRRTAAEGRLAAIKRALGGNGLLA